MDKNKKILFAIVGLLAAALVVWTVTTIPDAPPKEKVEPASKTMTYEGNTISESRNGKTLWEITAEHIEINADTKDVTLENVTGKIYGDNGREVMLKADKGLYTDKEKDISLSENIDIQTNDGMSLTCDELKWFGKEEMLAAIGNAKAKKDDMEASGDRIESKDAFSKFKIIGNAHLSKGGSK